MEADNVLLLKLIARYKKMEDYSSIFVFKEKNTGKLYDGKLYDGNLINRSLYELPLFACFYISVTNVCFETGYIHDLTKLNYIGLGKQEPAVSGFYNI